MRLIALGVLPLLALAHCDFTSNSHAAGDSTFRPDSVAHSSWTHSIVDGDTLQLDLRIPHPQEAGIPGVIFLHGGGFGAGQRNRGPHVSLLDSLAASGIASASISYRLTMAGKGFGCSIPTGEKQRAVESAVEDLMAAHGWLDASPLPLPEQWIVMGSSAGAEAAMWAGYGQASSPFIGVVSFAGAISTTVPMPHNPAPFFGVHGLCDPIVPCGDALHRQCAPGTPGAWALCGGQCWAERMTLNEHAAMFIGVCSGDHSVCNSGMLSPKIQELLIPWLRSAETRQASSTQFFSEEGSFQALPAPCPSPCQ